MPHINMSIIGIFIVYNSIRKAVNMTEDEKKFLEAAFLKTFNYDPDEEEVDAKYGDEFNKWCDEELGK